MISSRVKVGDLLKEEFDWGIVLTSGPKTFDVIWIGGSTTRYRHGVRNVRLAQAGELDEHTRKHLTGELRAAKAERRAGARIRRGAVSPRR